MTRFSKLNRPRTDHYTDLAEMAAVPLELRIINHPFVYGNKLVALSATDVFLRMNGYKLKVDEKQAHSYMIGLLENNRCMMVSEHVCR